MVSLLSKNASLEAEREAAMKQAQSATRAAEQLMGSGDDDKELKQKFEKKELGKNKMQRESWSPS